MLLLYGGLLYATYWSMGHAPTGFIPEQDQGYLLVNVQLPDSASLERTQQVMGVVDKIALGDPDDKQNYPGIPGVDHTLSVAGQSFLLSANGSNFGSTFVILKPFDKRHSHEEYDAVIAEKLRRKFGQLIDDAVDYCVSRSANSRPRQRRRISIASRAARVCRSRRIAERDRPVGPRPPIPIRCVG